MSDAALDLVMKNWHAAEARTSRLEVALKDVLRMPTVPQQAKAIIREALACLVVTSEENK